MKLNHLSETVVTIIITCVLQFVTISDVSDGILEHIT